MTEKSCNFHILTISFPELKADLASLAPGATLTLTQTSPDAPTFMTVCAKLEDPQATYSAVIHSYGDVSDDGMSCQSFGPHYNPFGVSTFNYLIS